MCSILNVFSGRGFEAVLGGILDRWELKNKRNSMEGRSKSRFQQNENKQDRGSFFH